MSETNANVDLNEIAVLGNILNDFDGHLILTAVQHLTVDDFTDQRNRAVFQAMLELNAKGEIPEINAVSEILKSTHKFDMVGGMDYLYSLTDNVISTNSFETYITRIKDKALLQKFIRKVKDIYDQAQTAPITDVSEFIGRAETEINEIAKERSIKEAKRLVEISPSLVNVWVEQSKEAREKGRPLNGVTGIPTGYEDLDEITKGWHKGHLILIGARPSMGKTAFTLNLLYNVAKKGTPVIFFSLEMSSEAIEMRLLELASGLNSKEINSLDFAQDSTPDKIKINVKSNEETAIVEKLQMGLDSLATLPFYVDENPGTDMTSIAAKCRKLINGQNIKAGLIAIDYIGLISPSKGQSNDSRTNQVGEISRRLKQLARELKIPIIALSQLSRDSAKRGADHRPQLTDLRDSGSLEQDADMVFFLYRPDYYKDNEKDDKGNKDESVYQPISPAELNLAKNRDGSLGTVKFIFDKEHCSFSAQTDETDMSL